MPVAEIRTPFELRVTGALADDAHITYTPGATPHAVLSLEIDPPVGLPYRVHQDFGADPNVHFALSAQTAWLRRGCLVQVTAKGLRMQSDHGKAALRLLDVTDVIPIHHQAAQTVAATQEESRA